MWQSPPGEFDNFLTHMLRITAPNGMFYNYFPYRKMRKCLLQTVKKKKKRKEKQLHSVVVLRPDLARVLRIKTRIWKSDSLLLEWAAWLLGQGSVRVAVWPQCYEKHSCVTKSPLSGQLAQDLAYSRCSVNVFKLPIQSFYNSWNQRAEKSRGRESGEAQGRGSGIMNV